MIKTYTSRNQFNYSIKQVEIDYTKRTFIVRFGGQCHIDHKKVTNKLVNEKIKECEEMRFTLIKERY